MGVMDLDGMDIEDNKGGRPEKDEKEKDEQGHVKADGDPFTQEKNTESWWQEKVDDHIGVFGTMPETFEESREMVMEISQITHLNPVNVRLYLEEHGVFETDWDEYREELGSSSVDLRVPGTDRAEPIKTTSSTSSSSSDSGLGALIDSAKQ